MSKENDFQEFGGTPPESATLNYVNMVNKRGQKAFCSIVAKKIYNT